MRLRIEFFGHALIVVEQGFGIDVGKMYHPHLAERGLHFRAPQTNVFDRRHDARKQPPAKLLHHV